MPTQHRLAWPPTTHRARALRRHCA